MYTLPTNTYILEWISPWHLFLKFFLQLLPSSYGLLIANILRKFFQSCFSEVLREVFNTLYVGWEEFLKAKFTTTLSKEKLVKYFTDKMLFTKLVSEHNTSFRDTHHQSVIHVYFTKTDCHCINIFLIYPWLEQLDCKSCRNTCATQTAVVVLKFKTKRDRVQGIYIVTPQPKAAAVALRGSPCPVCKDTTAASLLNFSHNWAL